MDLNRNFNLNSLTFDGGVKQSLTKRLLIKLTLSLSYYYYISLSLSKVSKEVCRYGKDSTF